MELTWHLYNPDVEARRILVLGGSLGGDTAHQWGQVAGHLGKDALIVYVYLPGQGVAPPWDDADEPSMESLAGGIAKVVAAVREQRGDLPTYYAGLSLSGALGLYLARDHSDVVDGVVVVGSAATVGTHDGWLRRAEAVEANGTVSLVEETRMRWFTPDFIAAEPAKVSAIMEGLAAADDHSYAQLCRALAGHDIRADLDDILTPLLMVVGDRDKSTPMADVELVATSAPNADLRIVQDVAHQVTVSAPGTVADLVRAFARRVEQPRWSIYDINDGNPPT
jgi:pimeloyl-ACP methyl ester carboxylesterase